MSALDAPKSRAVLERLFAASALQEDSPPPLRNDFSYHTSSPQERADAMSAVYMPISKQGGNLLYALVRASRPQRIIEFGTSFGISTIYLAGAVADNGTGHIFSTELSAAKVEEARRNLLEAGTADKVTILNLPVLKMLEPRLAAGAVVVADDSSFATMSDYLHYVRDHANGYVSVTFPVADGMEISCWTGREPRP